MMRRLEEELDAELDVTRAAGADDGVGGGADVGRGDDGANRFGAAQVVVESEDVEVRVIDDVEELGARLHAEMVVELPDF